MKKPMDNKRSPKWPTFRKKFLAGKVCAVCGAKKKLEAHHVMPFHLDQSLELDEKNLIPLCESSKAVNCHLFFGHLGNFKSFNVEVHKDAEEFRKKVIGRP